MVATADHHLSSLAREQSLRKCFMAIHHKSSSPFDDARIMSPMVSNAEDDSEVNRDNIFKKHRDDQALRRRRSISGPVQCRDILATGTPPIHELPALPYSKYDQRQQRESSRDRPVKNRYQRRSSGITANIEQKIVSKRMNKKQQEQPCLTKNKVLDSIKPKRQASEHQCNGFRADYRLGEIIRSSSHMIPTSEQVLTLKKYDFAFVKRSDGSYSYAILADRSFAPMKGASKPESTEECMRFVMGVSGMTKMVRKRNWRKCIRLVSMEGLDPHGTRCPQQVPVIVCQEVSPVTHEEIEEDCVPNMVSFDPITVLDEECSLISSVSDKARTFRRSSM